MPRYVIDPHTDLGYTQNMPSLQKHRSGGRTYWRIVESRRVNGKPRPIPILYLGTANDLLNRLLGAPAGGLKIHSFQHGDVAALKAAADRLGVVSIIDRHVNKRAHRLSVGTTLLLAALNRAVKPRSKRGWASWAAQTSLHKLFPDLNVEQLDSQYFWDQMDCVELDALRSIEDDLTEVVVRKLGIKLDTLFYDTTNFFTYIASTNTKPEIAQRGHSKQKRSDLRLFSLALLVSRKSHIPLCSHVYEGNRVDSKSFPDSLTRIRERLEKLQVVLEDITLVYDKGNHSEENQAMVDKSPFGHVASLVPAHHQELMNIPVKDYHDFSSQRLGNIRLLRLSKKIWDQKRTVLLFVSEQLRKGQIRGLQQHLTKRLAQLQEWKQRLEKPKAGVARNPRSQESIRN